MDLVKSLPTKKTQIKNLEDDLFGTSKTIPRKHTSPISASPSKSPKSPMLSPDTPLISPKSPSIFSKSTPTPSSSPTKSGKRSWLFWFGILVILALLGFNIFKYMGEILDYLKKLFEPILSVFGYTVGETTKSTISTTASGSKNIIDTTANITKSGINILQNAIVGDSNKPREKTTQKDIYNDSDSDSDDDDDADKKTYEPDDDAKTALGKTDAVREQKKFIRSTPVPDNIDSRTQNNRSTGKAGYCYVGSDKGIRTCAKVSENEQCMSGDIFPTLNICVNPTLRA